MLQEMQKAIVTKIVDETYNTKRFFLEVQDCSVFDFTPGQFITFDLPIHEKKNKRLKSYSIASAPSGSNTLELVIVLLPGGLGTEYLFKQVSIGTALDFRGPQGHFVLPAEMPADLFLICTGTGLAPFRSMVHHLHNHQLPHQCITIVFGVRTQADLLYYQELSKLQETMQGFTFIPTLSREQWSGESGYVHAIYTRLCADKPNAAFMLCGWRAMIDEAKNNLLNLGYDKKQIHYELYG
jgi:ferredoxin-NADP reductase